MKTVKVFGFVFLLHCGALAVFLLQSGCRSTQPPSQSRLQVLKAEASSSEGTSSDQVGELTFLGADSSLDSAFNAGLDPNRSEPTRPPASNASVDVWNDSVTPESSSLIDSDTQFYTVQAGDHLWGLARKFGTTVPELQALNALNDAAALQIGQQLKVPNGAAAKAITAPVADSAPTTLAAGSKYQVLAGDSLSKIAKRFNTRVATLKELNGLTDDRILVGDRLVVPAVDSSSVATAAPVSNPSGALIHVVAAGEYPSTIAKRYGMSVQDLLDANGITDPRKLQVGQKLTVGEKPAELAVASKSPTPAGSSAVNALTPEETLELNAPNPVKPSTEPVELNPVQTIAQDLDALVQPESVNTDAASDIVTDEVDELFESAIEIPVIRVE
jgi:LysM repeat protein